MNTVRVVGIQDLVRLTLKSIDEKVAAQVKATIHKYVSEATGSHLTQDRITEILDHLAKYNGLDEAISSTRGHINNSTNLVILLNTFLVMFKEADAGTTIVGSGNKANIVGGASGDKISRKKEDDETFAWDIINNNN